MRSAYQARARPQPLLSTSLSLPTRTACATVLGGPGSSPVNGSHGQPFTGKARGNWGLGA
jgi:hypothetical protein